MIKPVFIAIPFFVSLIALEALYDWRKQAKEYETKDTWTNILVGLISLFWGALFGLLTAYIYYFCYEIAPFKMPADAWWSWVLLVFIDDFAYYWFHRVSHESRFFWNFHVVHHSSEHYNLSVAVRQSWFGNLVNWLFYFPLMLLGFSPFMFATVHGLNLVYQFWIHTKFIKRLGFLEYILNTPAHHRVHHAVNEQYLDKNYGGIFIIWDRLFGTFTDESEEPRYGVIKPIKSYNWFWINTHGWFEMWEAMKIRKTIFGKLRCILGSPNMDFEEKTLIAANVNKQI
jgi:alkylglycerol monooxygenase